VSESTRQDLLAFYDVDPSRAVTILSGLAVPSDARHPTPDTLPGNYILFVSTIEPRKNLEVLLDAFARLRARGAYDGALVVVGRVGWKSESIIPRLGGPGVHHLDYVPPPQLASIYRNAELFVFPSIYEGFGFPLLEAMAYGIPSIAARSSSLPEIGGEAALYFEPRDARALEAQMERALTDTTLRAQLSAEGIARAAQFRWDVAAEKTLAVLRHSAS
jgi:glycosyltransferase involved in cell wall biosynthesis